MVLLSIVWFIMSIELTIRWNGVQGVDTIQTTGQLIPFIIGCVSISQVMKKVFFMGLRGVSARSSLGFCGFLTADRSFLDGRKYGGKFS